MAKIVCLTSVFTAWNSLWDFCDLEQSDNSMNELHLRFFSFFCQLKALATRTRRLGEWGRVKSASKVRKSPYSFKRLVNVYKVRLNVYKIKRQAHP